MTASAPFLSHNQNDHRALVMVTAVVFCLLMVTALIGKHIVRLRKGSSLHHFDYILFCGALLMLFQTACVVLAVVRGLGKHLVDVLEPISVSKVRDNKPQALSVHCLNSYSCSILHHFLELLLWHALRFPRAYLSGKSTIMEGFAWLLVLFSASSRPHRFLAS